MKFPLLFLQRFYSNVMVCNHFLRDYLSDILDNCNLFDIIWNVQFYICFYPHADYRFCILKCASTDAYHKQHSEFEIDVGVIVFLLKSLKVLHTINFILSLKAVPKLVCGFEKIQSGFRKVFPLLFIFFFVVLLALFNLLLNNC